MKLHRTIFVKQKDCPMTFTCWLWTAPDFFELFMNCDLFYTFVENTIWKQEHKRLRNADQKDGKWQQIMMNCMHFWAWEHFVQCQSRSISLLMPFRKWRGEESYIITMVNKTLYIDLHLESRFTITAWVPSPNTHNSRNQTIDRSKEQKFHLDFCMRSEVGE